MKINRLKLIEIIKTKLDTIEADRLRRYELAVQVHRDAERKYFEDTRADWATFAQTIERTLSQGKIMRASSMPSGLQSRMSSSMRFFDGKPPVAPQPHEQEAQLRTLISVLEQSSDEEVSTHALEKIGFPLGRILK